MPFTLLQAFVLQALLLTGGAMERGTEAPAHLSTVLFKRKFKFIFLMCMGVLPACTSVYHVHAVPMEARKGCWILELSGCRDLNLSPLKEQLPL